MSTYRGPLAGTASLTINGEAWSVVGELQWQAAGDVNETLKGQSTVEGFQSMPGQGFIQVSLRDRRDKKVSDFQGASGLTIIAVLANGKIITVVDGWQVEQINTNTQEGTFELKVESDTVTEDTAS
ncbi:phage tail tube protein [Acetobacter sp. TBRC 12305]|uniref:Phage tail tube protein n=1 Tax=Acetobacter garciniae TaxID=2817435 RepID=A0A939KQF4_9PROT|nr:phage tail tube protein [Acetobacter garciniae]MBO1325314.1 phage tail tube protein [Acetobacter garciniae]MBX0344714.1 phage tail tube protein [Acetobacter garciniae]